MKEVFNLAYLGLFPLGKSSSGKGMGIKMEMNKVRFSIIVVCLNPGEKLNQTLDSILKQTCRDYEVVVKDGGSGDGSIETMRQEERIRLFSQKDTGIYEAMNQAVQHARGDYILFLNCGDVFHDEKVLERTAAQMEKFDVTDLEGKSGDGSSTQKPCIFYGDTYSEKNNTLIAATPKITGFSCYRNIPCHQSCFYATELCKQKPYDPQYRIRADYDHFLWCFYVAGAQMIRMEFPVGTYEGGGYSESKANQKRDKEEHRQICRQYMKKGELLKYRLIMICTLAPLRSAMAESKGFSKIYHKLKQRIYEKN